MKRRTLLAVAALAGPARHGQTQGNNSEWLAASLAILRTRMPAGHPRLLVRANELPAFAAFLQQDPRVGTIAAAMKRLDLDADRVAPPPEPLAALGKSGEETQAARTAWRTASTAATTTQLLALRALLYGKPADHAAGVRWLTSLLGWQMVSAADYWRNPEAFVQTLHALVFAYDWLHEGMTATQQQATQSRLAQRLDTLFTVMRSRLTLETAPRPADGLSHPLRYLSTLGHAAMALWGHHRPAQDQLAWILAFYQHRFPVWGGDDGGWSEGLEYHSSGLSQHLRLLEDLSTIGVSGPLARPFWRNTGYFLANFLPPYESSSFSDLPAPPRPTAGRRLLLDKLARLNRDGQLLTLAERYGNTLPAGIDYYQYGAVDSIFHVWRTSLQARLQAESIEALPRSRHFQDVGWVSMQSGWDTRGDTIMLGFKSSPFGSVSHGFADQNAFVINAFRHAMAISTGMRDWFGSPHYENWTRATRSNNAVLVNGQGAPVHDAGATGRIVRFVSGRNTDFVTGDASPAYRQIARKVLRHIVFVDRRYFVMLDEISSDAAATHQWLLHAPVPMQLDNQAARFDIRLDRTGLRASLVTPPPDKLQLSQSDHHDPRPQAPATAVPAQWHGTAECREPSKERKFLACLYPWQGSAPTDAVQAAPATIGNALRMGGDTVLMSDEAIGRTVTPSHELDGRAAYEIKDRMVLIEGRLFKSARAEIRADVPVTVELATQPAAWVLDIAPHVAAELSLAVTKPPARVNGPAGTSWTLSGDGRALHLRLPATAESTQLTIQWQ